MTDIDHQARAHAVASASGSHIYLHCTASIAAAKGKERKSTSYTREGTCAHEVAENWLMTDEAPVVGSTRTIEGEEIEVTDEMVEAVSVYVQHVKEMSAKATYTAIEKRVSLDRLWKDYGEEPPMDLFGTADFVAVRGEDRMLVVSDLKYGKGVSVNAEENTQLMYYALGAYFALPDWVAELVQHVQLNVVQPRAAGPSIKTWNIGIGDLLIWGDDVIRPTIERIVEGDVSYKAGSWCRWCSAASYCPELHKQSVTVAKSKFADLKTPAVALPAPQELDDDALGEALRRAEIVSAWLSAVRGEVQARLVRGTAVNGWKLVEKRAHRRWTSDEDIANRLLGLGYQADDFAEAKVRSPAQIERMLKSDGHDPVAVMDGVVATPETGTTLVPEDDKRPAVITGPQVWFPTVE